MTIAIRHDDGCEWPDACLCAERARIKALANIRLYAARHRREDWAKVVLRFCDEGGAVASPLRAPSTKEPA